MKIIFAWFEIIWSLPVDFGYYHLVTFECFFDAVISANNIKVEISYKIDYVKRFVSDKRCVTRDILGVLTGSLDQLEGGFHG